MSISASLALRIAEVYPAFAEISGDDSTEDLIVKVLADYVEKHSKAVKLDGAVEKARAA